MKKKFIALACLVLLIAGIMIFLMNQNEQPTEDKFGWAVFHRQDEDHTICYDASSEDLDYLFFHYIKDEEIILNPPSDIDALDSCVTIEYDGKIWKIRCYTDDYVGFFFPDGDTAASYGYDQSSVFIKSRELWVYIVLAITNNGRITKMPLT